MRSILRSSRSRFYDPKTEKLFFIGLDLGQSKDYSASCIIERPAGTPFIYHVRDLKRYPLGTPYTTIVGAVKDTIRHPNIQPNLLLIDNTGVGRPISDLFRQAGIYFGAITITGGDRVSRNGICINVPKRDLVSTLQVLFQTNRLKVAGDLPEAKLLVEELLNFQVKISPLGHDSYGCWREGTHDDLILATAMACWASEKKLLPKGLMNPRPKGNRRRLKN